MRAQNRPADEEIDGAGDPCEARPDHYTPDPDPPSIGACPHRVGETAESDAYKSSADYEYRVRWRRRDYKTGAADRVHVLQDRRSAAAFFRRVRDRERLSPLTVLIIERRAVGEWQPATLMTDEQ